MLPEATKLSLIFKKKPKPPSSGGVATRRRMDGAT